MEIEATSPAYRIETARLVVRCWEPADVELLDEAVRESIEHLRPWMPWSRQEPISPAERLEFVRRCRGSFDTDEDYVYGIFDADESEVLGGTGLHTRRGKHVREIGYWIRAGRLRNGFATEATRALTRVGLQVDEVDRIEIRCAPDNEASAGIPAELGFKREGILEKAGRDADGEPRDTLLWSMTPDRLADLAWPEPDLKAYDVLGQRIRPSGGW